MAAKASSYEVGHALNNRRRRAVFQYLTTIQQATSWPCFPLPFFPFCGTLILDSRNRLPLVILPYSLVCNFTCPALYQRLYIHILSLLHLPESRLLLLLYESSNAAKRTFSFARQHCAQFVLRRFVVLRIRSRSTLFISAEKDGVPVAFLRPTTITALSHSHSWRFGVATAAAAGVTNLCHRIFRLDIA